MQLASSPSAWLAAMPLTMLVPIWLSAAGARPKMVCEYFVKKTKKKNKQNNMNLFSSN
jgi:hypothetical protein